MFRSRIDRFAARFASRLSAPSFRSSDPIAAGDRLAAAKDLWPEEEFPTLYRDIPADIRRPVVWDGRILGGREVGWLSWQHLTPRIVEDAVRTSGYTALRVSIAASAIVFVLWFLSYLPAGTINLGLVSLLVMSDLPFLAKVAALVSFLVSAGFLGLGLHLGYRFFGGRNPSSLVYSISAAAVVCYGGASLGTIAASIFAGQIPGFDLGSLTISASRPSSNANLEEVAQRLNSVWLLPSPRWMIDAGEWTLFGQYLVAQVALFLTKIPLLVGLVAATALLFAILFPTLWTFGAIRTLRKWADQTGAPYRIATRDALLVWKSRSDGSRDAEYLAYSRQVEDACGPRLAPLPLIPVGRASGLFRARGDMKAPVRQQLVAFDGESLRSHTLALGDTGTGKTRDVILPLFKRIMNAPWGADHRLGAYVTDGKGTLWKDLIPHVAHRDDVIVVGVEKEMWGVDLLAGMTPLEVANTFKSVAGQVAGKPADDFWTESASLLVMHAAAIAEALQYDPSHGLAFGECRPYSLSGVAVVAVNEALGKAAAERIMALADMPKGSIDDRLYNATSAAIGSADWLLKSYFAMGDDTRGSVAANVNVVLGKLAGAGDLARRFAYGLDEETVDLDHALNGGVVMIAIGETEHGMAGRIVATWLKSRLYVLAKRRLVKDPKACERTSCAMFADEFQMLVSMGQNSDQDFWNIARQTGVFMACAATQSVAALKQIIGHDQTANLLNLFRNKIALSTGEVETIDYLRKLVGDVPQGWEPDEGFYATQASRERAEPGVAARVRAWFPLPVRPRLDDPSMSEPIKLDERFDFGTRVSAEARASALQSAQWRSEDKSKEALTSGLSWTSKVRHDELRQGHGLALAIIHRAGLDRADIIDLRSV